MIKTIDSFFLKYYTFSVMIILESIVIAILVIASVSHKDFEIKNLNEQLVLSNEIIQRTLNVDTNYVKANLPQELRTKNKIEKELKFVQTHSAPIVTIWVIKQVMFGD